MHNSNDIMGNDLQWMNPICSDQLTSSKLYINYSKGKPKTTTSNINLPEVFASNIIEIFGDVDNKFLGKLWIKRSNVV